MTGGCQTVRALCQDDCEMYVCLSERLFSWGWGWEGGKPFKVSVRNVAFWKFYG